jgi:hypothetical protein
MQTDEMSFFDWQARFSSDEACAHFLAERRWAKGFLCPRCGHAMSGPISLPLVGAINAPAAAIPCR